MKIRVKSFKRAGKIIPAFLRSQKVQLKSKRAALGKAIDISKALASTGLKTSYFYEAGKLMGKIEEEQ